MGEVNCSMGPGRPCSPDGGRFNKAWSDPGGVAKPPVLRLDRTERPDCQAGEGWLESELSPLGRCSSEETQMVWLRFLPKLGKNPDFIPSRPHAQDESRAILSAGMNHFMGGEEMVQGPFPSIGKIQTLHRPLSQTYCVPG